MNNPAKAIFASSLQAILNDASDEKSNLKQIFNKVASYPARMFAAFFTAPFLILRIALQVKNPTRRLIAIVGLALALFLAYAASTYLGKLAGTWFVMTNVGFLMGLGFLVGSTLSVFLSVSFSIFILNSVAFLFLKMSTQEVVDYLNEISAPEK